MLTPCLHAVSPRRLRRRAGAGAARDGPTMPPHNDAQSRGQPRDRSHWEKRQRERHLTLGGRGSAARRAGADGGLRCIFIWNATRQCLVVSCIWNATRQDKDTALDTDVDVAFGTTQRHDTRVEATLVATRQDNDTTRVENKRTGHSCPDTTRHSSIFDSDAFNTLGPTAGPGRGPASLACYAVLEEY